MKKIVRPVLTLLMLLVFAAPAPAQFYPDPVDLGINNEQQEIEEWFWPALARQILLKYGSEPPTQCQIMTLALAANDGLTPSPDCCLSQQDHENTDLPRDEDLCQRPLDEDKIIKILEQFGLRAEMAPKPTSADEIYEHLFNGRALLVGFLITKDKRHAYLVRGISWTDEGQPMLLINDPHVTEPFQAPLAEEIPGWRTVIAIQ